MGNCCTVKSSDSVDWAGEDWGSFTSNHHSSKISSRKVFYDEDQKGHGDDDDGLMKLGSVEKEGLLGSLRASSDANGKVKIMISKKELEKLLKGSPDNQMKKKGSDYSNHHEHSSSSAELVLARLIYAKDHYDHRDVHHRHWKPALQSIPEVN